VTVAVISTGVDPYDPGLTGKVRTGPDLAFTPQDPLAHEYGTSAASIIAASGPSGSSPLTALGIAPAARILSIRAYPQPDESGASAFYKHSNLADLDGKAIDYAVEHGAQVIYVQLDTNVATPALIDAVQLAVAKKAIVVAAALGWGKYATYGLYPPDLPGVIGAGSIWLTGGLAAYNKAASERGNGILIAGPGNTFFDSSGYGIDGPGAAAAVVAGTVALIKSLNPGMTVAQVELALARSARYHPHGGYDTTIGFGLVDPYAALQAAATIARSPATTSPAGVPLSALLAPGQAPGTINAVRHPAVKLIIGAAALAAGLALFAAGLFTFARRGRRRRAGAHAVS
jgi:hypothetical protein